MSMDTREIYRDVLQASRTLSGFPRPRRSYWAFAAGVCSVAAAGYLGLLFGAAGPLGATVSLAIAFSAVTVLAISLGHQAFHGSLFASRRASRIVGLLTFVPLGIDGGLWRLRHLRDHHPRPNTKGHDADLDNPVFFRLAPYTERRWYHRFQHLYAPILYSLGVIVTIGLDDFRAFLREAASLRGWERRQLAAAFSSRKLAFVAIWFLVPYAVNPDLSLFALVLGFAAATIPSAWLFLPIAAAHLNEDAEFYESAEGPEFSLLQAETTVDFASQSTLMTMIYGGLNCHLAHHLWPKVSCSHYREMYRLLEARFPESALAPKNLSCAELIASHFRLLKRFGCGSDQLLSDPERVG